MDAEQQIKILEARIAKLESDAERAQVKEDHAALIIEGRDDYGQMVKSFNETIERLKVEYVVPEYVRVHKLNSGQEPNESFVMAMGQLTLDDLESKIKGHIEAMVARGKES